MVAERTRAWYRQGGYKKFNYWLCELRPKHVTTVYFTNFEFVPEWVDLNALMEVFNDDTVAWVMHIEPDGVPVIKLKSH